MGVPDTYPKAPFFITRNDVSGSLLVGVSDVDTSLAVDIPLEEFGWDAVNNDMRMYVTVREGPAVEIMLVTEVEELTAGVSSTLTATRAADGTTAHAFTSAARVSLNVHAGMLNRLAGVPLPALVGGSNQHRHGIYGNATTEVTITNVSGDVYIHLPTESVEWRRATIMIKGNGVFHTPLWATNLPLYWENGVAPAFSSTVDYILVELYHHYGDGKIFGRWSGFDV